MPRFTVRTLTLAPGQRVGYEPAWWRDALVIVESGVFELVERDGARHRFGARDVLWLDGLPLTALHNPSHREAVVTAISRTCPRRRAG